MNDNNMCLTTPKIDSLPMRRVCIFCEKWESGGIEAFIRNILININSKIVSYDIIAAELRDSIFTEELKKQGIRFFELSGNRYDLRNNHFRFKKLISETKYDIIHINAFQATSSYYAKIARLAGIKTRILHSHNNALKTSLLSIFKLIMHNIYKALYTKDATNWWACSSQAAKFMFSKSIIKKKSYQIIPNAINLEKFRFNRAIRNQIREELGLQDYLVIGNVGRLCKQKNQMFLLEIFQQIQQHLKGSILLLVGEGEDREKLEKRARLLGIAESVLFYGNTDRVSDILMAMDIFVFPSIFEGFGIAVLEAQASGLPVLCSENVPKEAIQTNTAQSFSLSYDADVWATKVLDIYNNHDQNRQHLIDDLYSHGFDIHSLASKIEQYYMIS